MFIFSSGLVHPSHDELEAEWSAHSAHSLASFKVDLPRVHQHSHHHNQGHPELRPTRSSAASGGWPRTSSSSNNNNNNSSSSSGGNGSGYSNNGVSAVGHLLAGSGVVQDDFQRGHSKKQPLRATIASRSSGGRPKLSEATRHSTSASAGPASLPNQFIVPRAPIPTPEVLAAKKAATKSNSGGGKTSSHNSTVKCSADRVDHRTERAERATDHRTERAAERAADHRITERAKPTSSEHFPSRPETEINLESKNQIYQSPRDRDGDYSYAYDCSISPAVVIKWGESEDEDEEPIKGKIYKCFCLLFRLINAISIVFFIIFSAQSLRKGVGLPMSWKKKPKERRKLEWKLGVEMTSPYIKCTKEKLLKFR